MKTESDAILLRIFIGESDKYEGRPLYKHIRDLVRAEGLAGVTVLRGIGGYGKSSHLHTSSILALSQDMPIVLEIADTKENIKRLKKKLNGIIKEGLITEEKVKIILYQGREKE